MNDVDWADIADSDQDTTTHTFENLNAATHYTLYIRAVNYVDPGASASVYATTNDDQVQAPEAPVNLEANTITDDTASVTWDNPSDGSIQSLSLIHISEPTRPY